MRGHGRTNSADGVVEASGPFADSESTKAESLGSTFQLDVCFQLTDCPDRESDRETLVAQTSQIPDAYFASWPGRMDSQGRRRENMVGVNMVLA